MEKILNDFMNVAKQNLEKDGYLMPVAFLVRNFEVIGILGLTFQDEEEKEIQYIGLGNLAKKNIADGIIVINDVAMRMLKNPTPDEIHAAIYDPTERPLSYPESMRQEAIALIYHNLVTSENQIMLQIYKKNGDIIEYGEFQTGATHIAGNIGDNIQKGYTGEVQLIS